MSPRADKSPLSAIMREAPHAALIPLVPGALQATNLIGQAQYIAALEMAAALGVTLILVATYNLADLLLNRPLSRLIAERASRQHAINARQDSSAPGNREALSLPDQSAEART